MKRFIEGEDRRQATLLPDSLEDYVTEDNPVRVVDVFIDELDLEALGFSGVVPEVTGRPAYHPATLLKIYLSGYLNRIQSSRRLERESQRNIELMWLTGRLMPDFKTIADFRRDSGPAIRAACAQFVVLCRQFNLFTRTIVAIDGSKFKAVKVGAAKDYEAKYSNTQLMGCPYCSCSPPSVTPSKKAPVSRLRNSTSPGKNPPADACPLTVPGLMVTTLTSAIFFAASFGSKSGLS